MAIKWGIPCDEIHQDELDIVTPIAYDGIDEERGEQTRSDSMVFYQLILNLMLSFYMNIELYM